MADSNLTSLTERSVTGVVRVVVVQLGIMYGAHVSRLIVRYSDYRHITMLIWVGKSNDWVISVSTAT